MLEHARAKANERNLQNVSFTLADMSESGLADASFDAVVSVFSLFFVPDMESQVAELWRLLAPGGKLAVTVWGPGAFEPAATLLGEELGAVKPGAGIATRPWERLTVPENLRHLLLEGGTTEPEITPVEDRQPLARAQDWWTIAMGSGFRWEIDQLTVDERERVRSRAIARLSTLDVRDVGTGAIHAIARKPF
jgi:SAM-dependent methyltransferase